MGEGLGRGFRKAAQRQQYTTDMNNEKLLTHEELMAQLLKNPAVRTEVERLNREEYAALDQKLAAHRAKT